jgi:hypothetical protein
MTIEKLCFLNLEDIAAVRIACGKCQSSTTVPVTQLNNVASLIENNCIACGEPSGIRRDTDAWNRTLKFIDALGRVASALKGMNVKLSLRIDCSD